MSKTEEISLRELKKDPIPYFYRYLNCCELTLEQIKKVEKSISLIEKFSLFNQLLDFWFSLSFYSVDKTEDTPFNITHFCNTILTALGNDYIKIYPFGRLNEETGKIEYFEKSFSYDCKFIAKHLMEVMSSVIVSHPNSLRSKLFTE